MTKQEAKRTATMASKIYPPHAAKWAEAIGRVEISRWSEVESHVTMGGVQ